jgi:hypothetical protein
MNSITKETGVVTTSCGHSFHLTCISKWFSKDETCPCCRKETSNTEKLETIEESDDEDEYEDREVEFSRDALNAFLRRRGGSGLTEAMALAICPIFGVFTLSELRSLCIGNGARDLDEDEWDDMEDEYYHANEIEIDYRYDDQSTIVPQSLSSHQYWNNNAPGLTLLANASNESHGYSYWE